jgi:hypothetical protein
MIGIVSVALRGDLGVVMSFLKTAPPGVTVGDPLTPPKPTIKEDLQNYLDDHGLSDVTFARRIGVDKSTVGRIRNTGSCGRALAAAIRAYIKRNP